MSPGKISRKSVADRLEWIDNMTRQIESLPLQTYEAFTTDKRNIWSAESCLRRAIEALMDLGRHILAKGFTTGVTEYKQIASGLREKGILGQTDSARFRVLAGYRNRMVHFYHEISDHELYEICKSQLTDVTCLTESIRGWIKDNPELIDSNL